MDTTGDKCSQIIRSLEIANEARQTLEAIELDGSTYIVDGVVSLLNPKAAAFLHQSQLDFNELVDMAVGNAKDKLSKLWEDTHASTNGSSETTEGKSWKFTLTDKMKLPTVRKVAKTNLMVLDVQHFLTTFDSLRELRGEYESKCTQMNCKADAALLEKVEQAAQAAKVTEAEWLICALLDSAKRDSEEKRKKAHQIKKRVIDSLPEVKNGDELVKPDGWSLVLPQLRAAAVELMSTA
jgi:hypothetical protein